MRSRVTAGMRWFFRVAAGLALIAGVLLFIGATETDRFFSWTIEPPLTAAFLGAAYWAAFVLLAWAAAQESWRTAQTAIPPVLAIAVLLLVTTFAHLDKFDFDSVFGWFWTVVYIAVTPLLVFLVLGEGNRPHPPLDTGPRIPVSLRALLSLQAAVMLALGAALMIAPEDAASLWPWTLTPLTGRAIGAFLIGFGVAAVFAVREDDLRRWRGAGIAYAALGALELLAAAIHSDDLGSGAAVPVYLGFVATVLAAGIYGSLAGRSSARLASSGSR
jgi:hypothetical protein